MQALSPRVLLYVSSTSRTAATAAFSDNRERAEAGEHWFALVEVRVAKIEAQRSTILWNSPCAGWLNDSSMIAREGPVSSQ